MGDGPPCRDGPELNVARHSGAKFPGAELIPDLSKTSNDLVHVGPLGWIFLDHIGEKRLHELEAMVFLVCRSQKFVLKEVGKESGPGYNILELSSQGNTHQWETDYTVSSHPDAQVRTCRHHATACRVVARGQGHKTERGRSR